MKPIRIKLDISVIFPSNHYGYMIGRSGNTCKGLVVHHGVIDPDFEGELAVMVSNFNAEREIFVHRGAPIAQLVIQPFPSHSVVESSVVNEPLNPLLAFGYFASLIVSKSKSSSFSLK